MSKFFCGLQSYRLIPVLHNIYKTVTSEIAYLAQFDQSVKATGEIDQQNITLKFESRHENQTFRGTMFFIFNKKKLLQSSLTFIESLEANFHVILNQRKRVKTF